MKKIVLLLIFFNIWAWGQDFDNNPDDCNPNEPHIPLISRVLFNFSSCPENGIFPENYGFLLSTVNLNINQQMGTVIVSAPGIKMGQNFRSSSLPCISFGKYNVHQPNTNGIIGTETYITDKDESITLSPIVNETPQTVYKWYDMNGQLVNETKDYYVDQAEATKYLVEVISETEGLVELKEVEVKYKPNRLIAMHPNPAIDIVTLNYKINEASTAHFSIINYYMGSNIVQNHLINLDENEKTVDVSALPSGFYHVLLIIDGVAQDVKILSKF